MQTLNLLALDLGASNGRGMLCRFDGKKIMLEEAHRFENNYTAVHGELYWNILSLYDNCKRAFANCAAMGYVPDAFGIDSWGVDYALIDKFGRLLSNPRSYRAAVDADIDAVNSIIPKKKLFESTGLAHLNFNTIFQLYRRLLEGDTALKSADTLLFLPDLLAYMFTGEKRAEYTLATTSMLYSPMKNGWDYEIIDALGLPHIFTQIDRAGTLRGGLLKDVADELSVPRVPFAAVGEHDTASAVAAIPGEGAFAFCSSGTWSLFGVETDAPVLSKSVYHANFSNEGTVQGGFRPLKNIMGLWLIQECRREWQRQGMALTWDDITDAARQSAPYRSIVDPDYKAFFTAGAMPDKIRAYCAATGQPQPETVGEIARCVYESLALKYRWALERLEEIKGAPIAALNIVGGGIQNKLLNQMAADAVERPVITGPIEGAAMGNALMQAVALGELGGIDDVRAVVRASADVEEYEPVSNEPCREAYARLLKYMEEAQ